jgi:DNA-binding XRE family transcriptional regulator
MARTSDAAKIAYNRYIKGKPEMEKMLGEERQRRQLAAYIREMRESDGMTQAELAKKIGTTSSAISRLEDPDYDGHSLKTIRRIARALGLGVELTLVKKTGKKHPRCAVIVA